MAVNVSVFDLVSFPNNQKTVTVDITEVVPLGNAGEDVWVFSANTTATASGGAAIQRLYINNTKLGWAKSSSLKVGPYNVTTSKRHIKVAIDEDVAGATELLLLSNDILPLSGDDIARDMEDKLNNSAAVGGDKAGNLSYLNATVNYQDNRFQIISGSASTSYTGTDRTSVAVVDGTTTTGLAAELGFDIPVTTEVLASTQIKETSLLAAYDTPEALALSIVDSGRVVGGDCIGLSDGTNTEFRGIESGSGTSITLCSGFANTYAVGSKVQVLKLQDVTAEPPPAYDTIDAYVKFGIATIVNQIDFSS